MPADEVAARLRVRTTSRTRSPLHPRPRRGAGLLQRRDRLLGRLPLRGHPGRSSRTRRRSRPRTRRRRIKPRPPEVQAVFDEAGFSYASGSLRRASRPTTRACAGSSSKAFTPRRIAALEPRDPRAHGRDDRADSTDRGQADLVADLAYELPALVIFRLLGVPDDDVAAGKGVGAEPRLRSTSATCRSRSRSATPRTSSSYWRYCVDALESRFDEPSDDLPGDLARIYQEGDESPTIDEIAGLVHTQLFAGPRDDIGAARRRAARAARRRRSAGRSCAPTAR